MKKENTALYVTRITVTLLLICGIVAAALAGVNAITAPLIAELQAQKTQQAIVAVLPGGGTEVALTGDNGIVTALYRGENGYAVQVEPSGFGGSIKMMVGIDNDGKVLGISVISQTETAGLGAIAAAANDAGVAFRGQFVGMSGTLAVEKDGGEVDSITGATITSRAVVEGINAAQACIANYGFGGASE